MRPDPGRSSSVSTSGLAHLIDGAVESRVLVHGSPPGVGRDLDLLVRPVEEARVAAALRAEGFSVHGHLYVQFGSGSVRQAEVIPASSWDLPAEEIEAVFSEAFPLEGFRHLVRPSPAHTLLILARRIVEGPGVLDDKRRAYIDWALSHDPEAWEHAEERSALWLAERPLELLQRLGGHAFVSAPVRAAVIEDRLRRSGRGRADARMEALRQLRPRRSPVAVVAISGLDGSGKSTQARLLVDGLERIGIPAATEWAKLGEDRRLWVVRRIVTSLLRQVRRSGRPTRGTHADTAEADAPASGPRYYESGPLLRVGWPLLAGVSNVMTFRLQVRRYEGRAMVLVYDRYVLDTAVHLGWRYGLSGWQLRAVEQLVAWLAPRPLRAFFLRLDPGVAWWRKREDAEAALREHAALYEAHLSGPAGRRVEVLDGSLPVADLAASIGKEVWEALHCEPKRRGLLRSLGAAVHRRVRS